MLACLFAAAGVLVSLDEAGAEAAVPKLGVGIDSVDFHVFNGGLFDSRTNAKSAGATLVLSNDGAAASGAVSVAGYLVDGSPLPVRGSKPTEELAIGSIPANSTEVMRISFIWNETMPATGWLIITESSQTAPSLVIPFTVHQSVGIGALLKPFAGLLFIVGVFLGVLWKRLKKEPRGSELKASTPIAGSGPTWTFKESWASNLTALGALLATVLGATGFISDLLPSLDVGAFVGMNLFYGFVLLLAPLVYAALSTNGKGTLFGLMMAAGVTMWAVLAEVTTTGLMLHRAGLSIWIGTLVFSMTVLTVLGYAWASIDQLVFPPSPEVGVMAPVQRAAIL